MNEQDPPGGKRPTTDSVTPPMYEPADPSFGSAPERPPRVPAFNIPPVIWLVSLPLIAIHAGLDFASNETFGTALLLFAFIPEAYHVGVERLYEPMARYWSPLTYFFLHGDWTHLLMNLFWMLAFGSAVAKRFGASRFLLMLAGGTLAAALAHFVTNLHSLAPVIGASGGVSACMGAAVRFAFAPGGVSSSVRQPSLSVGQALTNSRTMPFILIWFATNWLFGAGVVPIAGASGEIAWEAHIGGFLFGLLAFGWFDPQRRTLYRSG